MKMKHILFFTMLAASLAMVACKNDEPFSTITPDDQPCILNPIFPDRTATGDLAIYQTISRDTNLNIEMVVTPSEYTTVTWFLDGEIVQTGLTLDLSLEAGTYVLRVEATTSKGKSTYRECLIEVTPLDTDPWSVESGLERYVSPGLEASFTGVNLDKVVGIVIGDIAVNDIIYNADASTIEYTVPEEIEAGKYRLSLIDNAGNRYGANTVTVIDTATVLQGASNAAPGGDVTLIGVRLDEVASITIGEQTVTTFDVQTATELTFKCPDGLVEGQSYTMTGVTDNGAVVMFGSSDGTLNTEATILMSSEAILWEGHVLVDNWGASVFEGVRYMLNDAPVGSILRIYYSLDTSADYNQIRLVTGEWGYLMGESDVDDIRPTEDGVVEMELTQERLDLIRAQSGFICVGHGYYVDKVTLE